MDSRVSQLPDTQFRLGEGDDKTVGAQVKKRMFSADRGNVSRGPSDHDRPTALQTHVLFWDKDNDGMIYPSDTYAGFRELGFSILFSVFAGIGINSAFSYLTRIRHSYWPDPFFRIYVDSIHGAKHGSDSGVYAKDGSFVPEEFDALFARWDKKNTGTLTTSDLFDLIRWNRVAYDPFGWAAVMVEWGTTWLLIQDGGKISKEDLKGVYDGSLFWTISQKRNSSEGWHKGYGIDPRAN